MSIIALIALVLSACGNGSSNNQPTLSHLKEVLYSAAGNEILIYAVDTSTGSLTAVAPVPVAPDRTALADSITSDPTATFIFASDPGTDSVGFERSVSVHVFAINHRTGGLTEVSGSPISAGVPFGDCGTSCALVIDPSGRFLYLTTRHGLKGFTFDRTTGALTPMIPLFGAFSNDGAAGVVVEPSGKFAYAIDHIGKILGFAIDSTTGALTALPSSPFSTPPNTFPIGIAVHPTRTYLYASLRNPSIEGSLEVLSMDSSGALTDIPNSPFAAPLASTLVVEPAGKFLYGAEIPGSGLSGFTIDGNSGALTPIPGLFSPGAAFGSTIVTALSVDPGNFLYYAGAKADAIGGFAIDTTTGTLGPLTRAVSPPASPGKLAIVRFP